MSINIDNIYCNHNLQSNSIKYTHDINFESFNYPKHNILTSFHIKDTIHYNALIKDNYKDYKLYIEMTDQKEHSVDKFLNLKNNFDINKMEKICVEYFFDKNKYFVTNGVHRLSILLFKQIITDSIPIKYLEIKYDSKTIDFIKEGLLNSKDLTHYNGWNNKRGEYGYHSFDIFNIKLQGQRVPQKRLEILRRNVDFTNKNIVDFGCNTGGMLLHIFELSNGIGIDYDKNCIKIANDIHKILKFNNDISFLQMDLNNTELNLDSVIHMKIDIIFLFSIGSWIKNWKYIYHWSIQNSNIILFESNNDKEGISQLEFFDKYNCEVKLLSDASMDDNTNNYGRKTYIISKK
jgi:hypothetical protein